MGDTETARPGRDPGADAVEGTSTEEGLEMVVIVLTWCAEEDTRDCLESLLPQAREGIEILLVDNGSEDGSGDRLHGDFPDVPYVQTGKNLGYAEGNNVGIRWAAERDARRVLVLNNDTVVPPGVLDRLLATAETSDRIGAVVPRIVYDSEPDRVWYGGGRFLPTRGLGVHVGEGETAGDPGEPEDITFFTGCACLLSMDALEEVGGGFAADFFIYAEDAELSVRLRRAGYRIVYEPRATIRHRTPLLSATPSPFQIRLRDRNRRRLMRRHFGPRHRVPFLARFYLTRVIHLARFAATGDWPRARAILQGMWER